MREGLSAADCLRKLLFNFRVSAAASRITRDEGMPVTFTGTAATGRIFWVTFLFRHKKVTRTSRGENNA